jgi:hypothetical protein
VERELARGPMVTKVSNDPRGSHGERRASDCTPSSDVRGGVAGGVLHIRSRESVHPSSFALLQRRVDGYVSDTRSDLFVNLTGLFPLSYLRPLKVNPSDISRHHTSMSRDSKDHGR